MSSSSRPAIRRLLLKMSGEALMGEADYGIDGLLLGRLADELLEIQALGVELGVVIGGGNIFRGEGLARGGMDRTTGDHMGMLATVMNSLALQDALEQRGGFCRVMSALEILKVSEPFIRRRAIRHLEKGRIVVFAGGTGNPFFTTDSAASLRAIEIGADLLIKATKVDGVYDKDPMRHDGAVRYERLTFDEVLSSRLEVMDATAIVMCRDQGMPLRVMDIYKPRNLLRVVQGEEIGTLVTTTGRGAAG